MDLRRPLSSPPFASRPPTVLEIDLGRGLLASPPSSPVAAVRARNTPLLSDVVAGLGWAATDDSVCAVVVHIGGSQLAVAQAEELGAALAAFARSAKPVVAWTESFGELGPGTVAYYLACHASTIWMQPSGSVGLTGVAVDVTTLRGVLDKVGAEPQIGQRHEYKSAGERFMSREISAPNREMTQRIAESVMEQVRATVQDARGAESGSVADAVRSSPLSAPEALRRGLVDRLGYRQDVYDDVRRSLGRDGEVRLQYAHRYAKRRAATAREQIRRRRSPAVAVVSVTGGITVGRSGQGSPLGGRTAGSDTVGAALRAAADDDDVKAVVLRVDSPGGSYVASDAIRDEVLRVRATGRPVVASMGAVAASGGYFAAMPCDRVVALPSTLTGSIGVLGGKVVLAGTTGRLGVARETVGAGEHAAMFSSTRPFDELEWERVGSWLDAVYADFTAKAAADRRMELDDLEPLARGRVWSGADARAHRLVDRLGGLETAVSVACERAGLSRDRVHVRPVPHLPLLARLMPADSSESPVDAVAAAPSPAVPDGLLSDLTRALGLPCDGVLTLPWRIRIG